MNIRYRVELSAAERGELSTLLSAGKCAARKLKRAQILLAADAGSSEVEIERTIGVGGSTVYRTKRRFVEVGLEAALSEEPRPGAERKLTGKEEALHRHGLFQAAFRTRPLDARTLGRRDGQADRAYWPPSQPAS
jgi:transposase